MSDKAYWDAYQAELDLVFGEMQKLYQKVDGIQRKEASKWVGRYFKAEGGGAVFKVDHVEGHQFVGQGVRRALGDKGEVVISATDKEPFSWCLSWRPVEITEAEFEVEVQKIRGEML